MADPNAQGATPLTPQEQADEAQRRAECMGRWKHALQHVWKGDTWTDKRQCTTCGKVFDKDGREVSNG